MDRRTQPGLRQANTSITFLWVAMCSILLTACGGSQSALNTGGRGAEQIAELFWWMTAAGAVIWLVVIGISIYATRIKPHAHDPRVGHWLIIGGGAVFPTVALGALLTYGLTLMPRLSQPSQDPLQIAVSGERFWWRVQYTTETGQTVDLANEIRLPVGQQAEFTLTSPDVIHSFWIPSLGGKVDMIPGHTTRLVLEPTREGTFRGACAEYCGASHAFMNFDVVVMNPAAFDEWLARQVAPAHSPSTEAGKYGQRAFLANGCGACHQVRGTPAEGTLGPDLTHFGSRKSLAAGALPNTPPAIERWITSTKHIKPEANMPPFDMLSEQEISAMAIYLSELK